MAIVGERFVTIVVLNIWMSERLDCWGNLGTFHLSAEEQMIEARMHNKGGGDTSTRNAR